MKFNLKDVEKLVKEAAAEEVSTGDKYLDDIYDNEVTRITGHTNPYYLLWFLIADVMQPDLVVELGSWRAFGAAHFAVGNPNGHVVTIDIHKDEQQRECHAKAIEVAGRYDNLQFIHKWTWDAAEDVAALDKPIDVLFIDAWHEYQYAIKEWKAYEPLLADSALVICDDVFDAPGTTVDMLKFWDEISEGYENFITPDVHDTIPMGFFHYVRPGTEEKPEKKPATKKASKKTASKQTGAKK